MRSHTTPAERFWSKVEFTDSCWNWTAFRGHHGYARFTRPEGYNGRTGTTMQAHRWAYEFCVGPIPEGLTLDHLCDNTGCVNPDHLQPATQRANTLRGNSPTAINARKTHCIYGHPFIESNLYKQHNGGRRCKECHRLERIKRRTRKEP